MSSLDNCFGALVQGSSPACQSPVPERLLSSLKAPGGERVDNAAAPPHEPSHAFREERHGCRHHRPIEGHGGPRRFRGPLRPGGCRRSRLCRGGALVPELDGLRRRRLHPPDARPRARGDPAVRRPRRRRRCSAAATGSTLLHAALVNGISSHVFDFDDTHLKTDHPSGGPVASALLPLSETRAMSGRDFLHAFILGVEVECRIGNAVYPDHYDVGWHITGTAGVFGAAAAAAKVLGLDRPANHVGARHRGDAIVGPARDVRHHVQAVPSRPRRAERSSRRPSRAAELHQLRARHRGAARLCARAVDRVRSDEITEKLGETWEISLNTYKPFACGIVIHPAIDGCIQLRNAHGLKAADVASIALTVHPLVLELTGKTEPRTGLEGKFSVYHSCAAAIVHGRCGEHEYSDEVVTDPEIVKPARQGAGRGQPQNPRGPGRHHLDHHGRAQPSPVRRARHRQPASGR